jgi:micrococcal nuclease
VVRVVDGDTIVVAIDGEQARLRYIGIDTPETVHPDKPVEWMGPEASAANKALVEGKTVYLEKDISETDQYGRLLRYVFLEDGTFVNAELVRLGYAQVSTYPPDVRYVDLYLEMQRAAQAAGRGLWGERE